MRLFTVAKIPMYCEGITHRLERRRGEEVKVVDLALKIEPFTPQLASALDQDEYGFIKRTLFKHQDASPIGDIRAVEFRPPSERQKLTVYATPDTEAAAIAFDGVKVIKIRARCQKDTSGWVLYVHVSFGPLGKTELEYINYFYAQQRFGTWEQADPSFDWDAKPVVEEGSDADVKARRKVKALPPMFNTDQDGKPVETDGEVAADGEDSEKPSKVTDIAARQRLHSHAKGRKRKRSDDPPADDTPADAEAVQ